MSVLDDIECARIQDSDTFIDRFSRPLHISNLSTTAKILLLGHLTDYIIFGNEIGSNGLAFLAEKGDGSFLITNIGMRVPRFDIPVCVNGILYKETEDVENAIMEESL